MCEQTLPRQAQVVLTALFLSFEVRASCDSAVDFTSKKVVSVVAIFKIEVARDFYATKQRISTSWGVRLLTSRVLQEGSLRRVTVADGCLHRHAESNFRFVDLPACRSNPVSFHFTQTFPEKVLVVSNQAMFNSFVRRKKHSLPDVRRTACRIVDRSGFGEVLTAKGQLPHDEACRSLRTSTVFGRLQLQSQAASETHVVLFRPSWKREPFLIFVFRIWSRRMFIWSQ